MRKFNLFNFMEKKIDLAEISPVKYEVLEKLALKELALHIGVSYIANTLSKCEFRVFKEGEEVHDELYYRLNVSPNPNQNSSQFINQFIENYYYDGHALLVPYQNHMYCASNFDLDDSDPLKDYVFQNVSFGTRTLRKHFRSPDVFYMKLDNKNVKVLVDTLYSQYGDILSLALSAYRRTNGGKYKLDLEQYRAGDAQFNEIYNKVLKAQLKAFFDNDNAVYPQFKGTDLQEMSSGNAKDTSDIVAMRKEVFEITAQALKIPLSMMYGNITNMNEIVKVYLSICIDPLADMIGEEFTRKYYSYDEWKKGSYVEVDTSCINHVDILEVADKVDKAISSGAFSIDEIRRRLGARALNTEFSEGHWMTKNYMPAEDMLKGGETE